MLYGNVQFINIVMKAQVVIYLVFLMASQVSAQQIDSVTVLTLGDSNGAAENGWVNQMRTLQPEWHIINTSVSGNTVGFDNLNREELNTLKNLDRYLQLVTDSVSALDYVVILLGTNDAKTVFDERQAEVLKNMTTLIQHLKKFISIQEFDTQIILVSPPPYGPDEMLAEKYLGGNERVKVLSKEFKQIAENNEAKFVNIWSELNPVFENFSTDGVHLTTEGQKMIARKIIREIEK